MQNTDTALGDLASRVMTWGGGEVAALHCIALGIYLSHPAVFHTTSGRPDTTS